MQSQDFLYLHDDDVHDDDVHDDGVRDGDAHRADPGGCGARGDRVGSLFCILYQVAGLLDYRL